MKDFFNMGGYAAYVWPAYGISTLVIAGLTFYVYRQLKAREKTLLALRQASGRDDAA